MESSNQKSEDLIFISHSSEDKDTAHGIFDFLTGQGLKCWLAKKSIVSSEEYGQAIISAIKASKIMVVVFSKEANESDFVRLEVERAITNKLRIILFRVENILPTGSLEFFLSSVHWIDAFDKSEEEDSFEKLCNDCRLILGYPSTQVTRGKQRLFQLTFFFKGRITRIEYAISLLVFVGIWMLTGYVMIKKGGTDVITVLDRVLWILLLVVDIWFLLAQGIKRCHDVSKSSLDFFNPVVFIALPFLKGYPAKNKYGPNPRKRIATSPKGSFLNIAMPLLVICLLLVSYFTPSPVKPIEFIADPVAVQPGWNMYETRDYRIQYPQEWGVDSTRRSGLNFILFSPVDSLNDIYQENITFSIVNMAGTNNSLDWYITKSEREIAEQVLIKNSKLVKSERIKKDGQEYHVLIFTGDLEVNKKKIFIRFQMRLWFIDSQMYILTFYVEENKKNNFKEVGEEVLNSFVIKE